MDPVRAAQTERNQGWQHFDLVTARADSNRKIPEQMCSLPAPLPFLQPRDCSPPAPSTMAHGPSLQDPPTGLIPCELDLHSGSSSQSEKRKANSDASRRFRQKKKQLQAEIDRMKEKNSSLHTQLDHYRTECQFLRTQLDHYRSERDYFRSHSYLSAKSDTRPPSPSWDDMLENKNG